MKNIVVNALKDFENYYSGGCSRSVGCDYKVLGTAFMATSGNNAECIKDEIYEGDIIPSNADVDKISVTKIYHPKYGAMYVQESPEELMAKCNAAGCCCNITIHFPAGRPPDAYIFRFYNNDGELVAETDPEGSLDQLLPIKKGNYRVCLEVVDPMGQIEVLDENNVQIEVGSGVTCDSSVVALGCDINILEVGG